MNLVYYKDKARKFCWRLIRNLISSNRVTRPILFPQQRLAAAFGPESSEYSWWMFFRHYKKLESVGYKGAKRILEVGPGRNLGSGLLWWALESSKAENKTGTRLCLWDIYPNANLNGEKLRQWARALKKSSERYLDQPATSRILNQLDNIAIGKLIPSMKYEVCSLKQLLSAYRTNPFDLIYSQAALEHNWNISETWEALALITRNGGWHSHRIDLADHGSRDSNYIEMLCWSDLSYWLTMRFVPGAINRWRACHHLKYIEKLGFEVLLKDRDICEEIPVPLAWLSQKFRKLNVIELKTTGLDLIARRL